MPPVFGPGIAFADALVVLGRGERHGGLAVDEREQAGFLAVEEFLDHQRPVARGVDRRLGFGAASSPRSRPCRRQGRRP